MALLCLRDARRLRPPRGHTRDTLLSNQICLAAEQTRMDYQKETVDEAKKATELLGKQVGLASDAFKKASDDFPTG